MNNEVECPLCGGKALHEKRSREYTYNGYARKVLQPGTYCSACNEVSLSPEDLAATDKELAKQRAIIDKLVAKEDISRIRKKVHWSQSRAGEILGGGVNAFSRYETGKVPPPPSVSILLKLLDKNPELGKQIEEMENDSKKIALQTLKGAANNGGFQDGSQDLAFA